MAVDQSDNSALSQGFGNSSLSGRPRGNGHEPAAQAAQNQALNNLLIDVRRSLLQYADEAWPWTSRDSQERGTAVKQLAASQAAHAAGLAGLLQSRHWVIDLGTYPTDYTDLHYVSLDYFLALLAENQQVLLSRIEHVLGAGPHDAEATNVLTELLSDQRRIVRELKSLRQPPAARIA